MKLHFPVSLSFLAAVLLTCMQPRAHGQIPISSQPGVCTPYDAFPPPGACSQDCGPQCFELPYASDGTDTCEGETGLCRRRNKTIAVYFFECFSVQDDNCPVGQTQFRCFYSSGPPQGGVALQCI
jgi:hypothetical protein